MSEPFESKAKRASLAHAIRSHIKSYLRPLLAHGGRFHGGQLQSYVVQQAPSVLPASVDRILRMLRANGEIEYELISRSASLYRVTKVDGAG